MCLSVNFWKNMYFVCICFCMSVILVHVRERQKEGKWVIPDNLRFTPYLDMIMHSLRRVLPPHPNHTHRSGTRRTASKTTPTAVALVTAMITASRNAAPVPWRYEWCVCAVMRLCRNQRCVCAVMLMRSSLQLLTVAWFISLSTPPRYGICF